jgi:ABC-type multidrug transport system fused ATPase/permease subunit
MIISFKPVRKATQGQSAIADSAVGTTAVVPTAVAPSSANSPRRDTLRYVLQLLSRFVGDQQRVFVLGLIMLIAEAATSIFESYPLAYLIDYLNGERVDLFTHLGLPALGSPRLITIAALPIAIVLIAMINSLGDSLAEIYLARGGRTLGYNMRLALYTHLQRLSLAFHGQRRTGDTLTRVTADVSEIESFVISSLSDIAGSLLVLVGTMGYLIYQSWQVALVAVIVLPIMVGVSNYFSQHIKVATKKQRTQAGELASATQEMLTSIRVIQTYSPGNHELARFARFNQKSAEAALQAAVLQARFSWVIKVLEAVTVAVTVWVALWLMTPNMAEAGVTTGKLVLFIAMINNMFKPTRKIIKEWNTIGKIYASVERIGELLDRKPTVEDLPGAVAAPPFRGQVEFQDVSFAYQADPDEAEDGEQGQQPATRQVLKDVRFTVGQGEVMALVGYTGAGKSTILQLLPRLYDPSAGRIQIDGRDIRNFTLESLRGQIGVVLQETVLFGGSVADNIAYGRPDATREQIIQAAVQANAHEFIEKLPDGYDTLLGERGANLSGGQRQRIAIARAFVRNAPILILDEPTTGLDAQSAELVLLALRLLMRGKTTIIVSHDLKLVRQAHKIAVLKDGRIEEMGTHQELLERQGTYAMLHVKQYGKQAVEEEPVAGSLYDLLQSPVFQQKWPAAQTAFDGEAMQSRLQAALFGGEAGDHQILRCKPGKASFVEGKGCLLRYDLQVLSTVSGRSETIVLLARLFAEQEAAERYLRKRLLPLVGRLQGRPELALFTNPVALFDDLNLVVSPFPLDGELPALIDASDTGQMAELFGETLPDAVDGQSAVEHGNGPPGGRQRTGAAGRLWQGCRR